jgi:hypothetical protein
MRPATEFEIQNLRFNTYICRSILQRERYNKRNCKIYKGNLPVLVRIDAFAAPV